MKNMISSIFKSTALFTLLVLSSCGTGLNPVDPDRCEELQTTAEIFIDAAVLYGQDPSVENCKAYKTSIINYVEIIDDCGVTFGTGIENAQETIDDLDC